MPKTQTSLHHLVRVRGPRLRQLRELIHLRLADVAGTTLNVSTLSRLERKETGLLPAWLVTTLMRRLGVPVECPARPDAWGRVLLAQAMSSLVRGQFTPLLRTLLLRDLLVVQLDARTEITAQVLQEYARWQCEGNWRPQVMCYWKDRARESRAMAAWLWASVFEGMAYEEIGDVDRALGVYSLAARAVAGVSRCLPRVCAIAELVRVLALTGDAVQGRAILTRTRRRAMDAPPFGRSRWLHAAGLVHASQGATAMAVEALRESVVAALEIPNPLLAAEAQCTLSSVYRAEGDLDKADAAAVRSAALYLQAGRREKAARMLEDTLVRHGSAAAPPSPERREGARPEKFIPLAPPLG